MIILIIRTADHFLIYNTSKTINPKNIIYSIKVFVQQTAQNYI